MKDKLKLLNHPENIRGHPFFVLSVTLWFWFPGAAVLWRSVQSALTHIYLVSRQLEAAPQRTTHCQIIGVKLYIHSHLHFQIMALIWQFGSGLTLNTIWDAAGFKAVSSRADKMFVFILMWFHMRLKAVFRRAIVPASALFFLDV